MDLTSRLANRWTVVDTEDPPRMMGVMDMVIEDVDGDLTFVDDKGRLRNFPWAHKWKRLVTQLMMVEKGANVATIQSCLEKLRDRKEMEAYETFRQKSGSTQSFTQYQKMMNAEKTKKRQQAKKAEARSAEQGPIAKGRPLKRSTAPKEGAKWELEPEVCGMAAIPHETMSGPRGNQYELWITCLKCGSRWEREPHNLKEMIVSAQRMEKREINMANYNQLTPDIKEKLEEQYTFLQRTQSLTNVQILQQMVLNCNPESDQEIKWVLAFSSIKLPFPAVETR